MKNILLISCGSIGRRHLKNTRKLLPDCRIGIYRLHNTDAKNVPEEANEVFYSQEEASAFKPDCVIVSSPANQHVKNTMDFLETGANVFIEKPLATSSLDIEPLVYTAAESNHFTMVGYVLRFQPIFSFLKNYLASGKLGIVHSANVEVGQFLPDWRPNADYRQGVSAQKALGGGVLLELSHEVDYSSWLFGFPDSVICSADRLSNLEIDVEDSACMIMEFHKPKKRIVLQLDFLQRSASMRLQVVGSLATLHADFIKEEAYISTPRGTEALKVPKMDSGNEMYLRQFDYFFHRSFEDYQPIFPETHRFNDHSSIATASKVLKLIDMARISAETGKRIHLDG